MPAPAPVDVFDALCWARGHLWREGWLEGANAVDVLQQWAVDNGLVDELGQDDVQRMIAGAFHG